MKSALVLLIFSLFHSLAIGEEDDVRHCQKLKEKCSQTEECCMGTCVANQCNDGLFRNSADRSSGVSPDRTAMIAAELATMKNIDVSNHPNIHLLASLEECGQSAPPKSKRQKRIVGGLPYELGKYPWAVALHMNDIRSSESAQHCGGSLINRRYVITASHCLTRVVTGNMLKWATLGNVDRRLKLDCENKSRTEPCTNKQYLDVEIEDWVTHEMYSEAHVRYDIALIRLKHEVNYTDYIKPICLPRSEKWHNKWNDAVMTVVGWGTQNTPNDVGAPVVSYVAQEVDMNLVHRSNCDRFFTNMIGKLRRSHICAGGYPGKGDCAGDSGGPLFKKLSVEVGDDGKEEERYTLIGLVSTGAVTQCSREGIPSVFTHVMYHMPWILDHIVPQKGDFVDKLDKTVNPTEEFATGLDPPMDVSTHENIHLLPKFPECGNSFSRNFSTGTNHSRVKRIVGGTTQPVASMPWMVAIYVKHVGTTELIFRCGGVLISKRYVLTGGHCIGDITGAYVLDSVVLGSTNRKLEKECVGDECINLNPILIEDAILHETFSKHAREYDVALLRLSEEVKFNRFVQPVCLPFSEDIVQKAWPNPAKDLKYTAAGWGRVSSDDTENIMSNLLVATTLTLASKKYCESTLALKIGKLENKRICGGGSTYGRGECVGDTGGPMLRAVTMTDSEGNSHSRMFVFGVLSVVECASQGIPSIYQNILYHLNWILDTLEE